MDGRFEAIQKSRRGGVHIDYASAGMFQSNAIRRRSDPLATLARLPPILSPSRAEGFRHSGQRTPSTGEADGR
jgi:hypothetical protein